MDNLVRNLRIILNYFYGPNQAWDQMCWNYTKPVQEQTTAAQELFPALCAPSSENLLLQQQQQMSYTTPYTYNITQFEHPPFGAHSPWWNQTFCANLDQYQIPQGQQAMAFQSYLSAAYPTSSHR